MSHNPAYAVYPNRIYSYHTCIRQRLPNGLTIGNVTRYSRLTSIHQAQAKCRQCDIILDYVPRDTDDLLHIALDRGAVEYAHGQYRKVCDIEDILMGDTQPMVAVSYP